jgi:hypothetical protein
MIECFGQPMTGLDRWKDPLGSHGRKAWVEGVDGEADRPSGPACLALMSKEGRKNIFSKNRQ